MKLGRGVEGVCGKGKIGLRDGCMVVNRSATETGQGDRRISWVVEEILLGRKDVSERESLAVVNLLVAGERRGRVSRPDGSCLTVEFYKGATTFARNTFGCVSMSGSADGSGKRAKGTDNRDWNRHRGGSR